MLLRKLLFIVTIFALSGYLTPAVAREGFSGNVNQPLAQLPGGQNRPEMDRRRLIQVLNLSADQQKKMDEIRRKYQRELSQIRVQLRVEENKLRELMVGNNSSNQVREQQRKVVILREKLNNLHFESMMEIRAVLTPQQRNQFQQMMQQHRRNLG